MTSTIMNQTSSLSSISDVCTGSGVSGNPNLIIFLIRERQKQLQRQLVARQGIAIRSHMKSKGSSFNFILFPNTSDFLFLIFVLIWSIMEWIMSLGSIAFSICLKRARDPKRPRVEIVEVKADLIILPLVTCLWRNLPVELYVSSQPLYFFLKGYPNPQKKQGYCLVGGIRREWQDSLLSLC